MKTDVSPRRKYPRKAFKKKLSLIYEGHPALAKGVEIGEGGLSFIVEDKITVPNKLIINFFLSEKDFFSVRVSLLNSFKNTEGYTYGCSFDDVSIALKRQIRAYVARTG
jgi:hypothetical protein